MRPNARPVVLAFAVLSMLVLSVTSCDDSTGPRYTETFTLTHAPAPIEGGRLVLEYTGSEGGRAWYGLTHPHLTDFGTFRMRGSNGVDFWLRVGSRRSGDFDDGRRRVLVLNDGTRWKRRE